MCSNKIKKSVKFRGDTFFCDFVQIFVLTTNHHLNIYEQEKWHSYDVILGLSVPEKY